MTSDSPLISVCMPVYNAERYAVAAIESILGQTLGDFEFLILDDGSTDSSLEILRRYAGLDPRIRVTSRPNRGVAASLNELVNQSRGEFLARMDADDIAVPERFARQVEYLRAAPSASWWAAGCGSSTRTGTRCANGARNKSMRHSTRTSSEANGAWGSAIRPS